MMNAKEITDIWKSVVKIFRNTKQGGPKITVNAIIEQFGIEDTKEVFATVTAIKQHDGRINRKNREYMDTVPVNLQNIKINSENPVMYAGLDDIHTAHINQMITELRHMDQ